jgi:hypothetical protein
MIKKYEAEIFFLTRELEIARQHAHHERTLRQQLENELRQMFLKNMTSMNIEAFRIFQQAAVDREDFDSKLQQALPATATKENKALLDKLNSISKVNTSKDVDATMTSTTSEETSRAIEVVDIGSVFNSPASIMRHSGAYRKS